jgi:hypothetical protein
MISEVFSSRSSTSVVRRDPAKSACCVSLLDYLHLSWLGNLHASKE